MKIPQSFLLLLLLLLFSKLSWAKSTTTSAPLGPQDFTCGTYLIAGLFKTFPSGQDHLILYPESVRELDLRLLQVGFDDSQNLDGVRGIFKVSVRPVGKSWANFTFIQYVRPTTEEILLSAPAELLESCSTKEKK